MPTYVVESGASPSDKRYYTRYEVLLDGKIGFEEGLVFLVEILDISAEGARVKNENTYPVAQGEVLYLLIKAKKPIKVKAEVRWVKEDENRYIFGVKFIELDIATQEAISDLISEYGLSSLMDIYAR